MLCQRCLMDWRRIKRGKKKKILKNEDRRSEWRMEKKWVDFPCSRPRCIKKRKRVGALYACAVGVHADHSLIYIFYVNVSLRNDQKRGGRIVTGQQTACYLSRPTPSSQTERVPRKWRCWFFFSSFLTFNDTTIRTHRTKAHRSHYLKKNK